MFGEWVFDEVIVVVGVVVVSVVDWVFGVVIEGAGLGVLLAWVFSLACDFLFLLLLSSIAFLTFALSSFSCLLSDVKHTLIKLDWAISTLLFRLRAFSTWLML